jgi:hypothetical protein
MCSMFYFIISFVLQRSFLFTDSVNMFLFSPDESAKLWKLFFWFFFVKDQKKLLQGE